MKLTQFSSPNCPDLFALRDVILARFKCQWNGLYSGLGVLLEPTSGDCTGLSSMRSRRTEAAGDQRW